MSNEVAAIKKELSRVRNLKRAAEAEVELLRSDMERGVIHLRVPTNPEFRQELAQKMVAMSHPGWCESGEYWANLEEEAIFFSQTYDYDNRCIVSVKDCFDDDNGKNSFNGEIDWDLCEIPNYDQIKKTYLENEDNEEDKSIICWWALNNGYPELQKEVDACHEAAVEFALSCIKDEILVKI